MAIVFVDFLSDDTWEVPAGVDEITIYCGAGGGAGYGNILANGSGGAGGGFAKATVAVTQFDSIAIVVGQGGTAGGSGGNSSVTNNTTVTTLAAADGGSGGFGGGPGPNGGAGTTGDVVYTGGAGGEQGTDLGSGAGGGGGGGGAGAGGNGADGAAGTDTTGGAGGTGDSGVDLIGIGGDGGDGGFPAGAAPTVGTNGSFGGAGAGGGGTSTDGSDGGGGDGGNGSVRISYEQPPFQCIIVPTETNDDGFYAPDGSVFDNTAAELKVANDGFDNFHSTFIRFSGSVIPNSANISEAKLILRVVGVTGVRDVSIQFCDENNSSQIQDYADAASRTLTVASTGQITFFDNVLFYTFNCANALQQVVNRVGYSSGNFVQAVIKGSGELVSFASQEDTNPGGPPVLIANFTAGSGEQGYIAYQHKIMWLGPYGVFKSVINR